ncbi:hypothetical protein CCP4SC76_3870002 [Gammaproteobacteria bacterium]
MASGALWVDIRSQADYASGHLEGAVSLPSQKVRELCGRLPRDCDLLIYGTTPGQASAAAFLLTERGFNRYQVYSLDCGCPDLFLQHPEKLSSPLAPSATMEPAKRPANVQSRYEELLRKRLHEVQVLSRALDAMKQKVGVVEHDKLTLEARYHHLQDELARVQAVLVASRSENVGATHTAIPAQWQGLENDLAEERERNVLLQVEMKHLRAALKTASHQAKQAQAEIAQTEALYESELADLRIAAREAQTRQRESPP